MATISDLSSDLVEEILTRVPITSLGAVRSTCKRWNTLSKSRLLCKAHANQQFLGFMIKNSKLCSMRYDLHEEFSGKEISDSLAISEVFVSDGLLLCVSTVRRDDHRIQNRLMVWNPYLGQTRWIQPRTAYYETDTYALGYDNNHNHKILRYSIRGCEDKCEIYDFKSDSWKTLDLYVTPNWSQGWAGKYRRYSASLKGNTFFVDYNERAETYGEYFLCFDFTRERFGEKLPLPWSGKDESHFKFTPFSSFGEEKLAAIYENVIWVTTKIEPNEVLWSKFLKFDWEAIPPFLTNNSLFIDEDKKRAVFFTTGCYDSLKTDKEYYNAAYIIGENDFFKAVDLGAINPPRDDDFQVVCSNSYVPSLVQIKQNFSERQEEEASQEALVVQKKNRKRNCPFYNNMLFVSWMASFSIFFLALVAAMYFYQG